MSLVLSWGWDTSVCRSQWNSASGKDHWLRSVAAKVENYKRFMDPTGEVSSENLRTAWQLKVTTDPAALAAADFIVVAVYPAPPRTCVSRYTQNSPACAGAATSSWSTP